MNLTIETKRHSVIVVLEFLVFVTIIMFSTVTYGGAKMIPLYDINEAMTLKPEINEIGTDSLLSLFPVPQNNSIGTNDLNNAITILSFHNGKIEKDQYFKNAFRQVGGGGTFIPVIAQDTIGFGQVRRFVFYNFRTKRYESYSIVVSLEKTIEKIAIADAQLRSFIFEIEAHNPKSEDPWDYTNSLILMDLNGKEPKLIKEMNIGKVTAWTSAFDKIFLYNLKTEQMNVLTTSFESAYHPLADVINQNKGKIDFVVMYPHPYLPFAILSGGRKGAMLVNWGASRDTTPHVLINRATQFTFSPDGKWVVFRKKQSSEEERTYLMPVSEKYPHYLGSPILLTDEHFNEKYCGWTTNPISFVGSYGEIFRWDLDNQPHPGSDKMSFHDYIVEQDLEKLRKEKKQGLGE